MHPILIEKLAETLVADRLREAERRNHARRGDHLAPRKASGRDGVGRFVVRLAPRQNDAAVGESCPAGCTPRP